MKRTNLQWNGASHGYEPSTQKPTSPVKSPKYRGNGDTIAGPQKPTCWIVDVDGTLALLNGRDPYETVALNDDVPNQPVIQVVRALACHPDVDAIVVVSGRQERSRKVTLDWLEDHGIPFNELHMRPTGDNRPDQMIKEEILDVQLLPRYEVVGVLDDRQKVVDMWRRNGLTCFQVAPGDF